MDPVTTISSQARLRTNFRVRRRRYNAATVLVFHNDWYQVDAITDTVWLACEQGATVGETVQRVADEHKLPLQEAVAAVSFAVGWFLELGMAELA